MSLPYTPSARLHLPGDPEPDPNNQAPKITATNPYGLILGADGVPAILSGPIPGTAEYRAAEEETRKAQTTIPENETEEEQDAREKALVSKLFKEAYWVGGKPVHVWPLQVSKQCRSADDDDVASMAKWYATTSKRMPYLSDDAVWTHWGFDFSKEGWLDNEKLQIMRILESFTRPEGPTAAEAAFAYDRAAQIEERIREEKQKEREKQQERQVRKDLGLPPLKGNGDSESEEENVKGYRPSKYMPGVVVPPDWNEPEGQLPKKVVPDLEESDEDIDMAYHDSDEEVSADEGFSSSHMEAGRPNRAILNEIEEDIYMADVSHINASLPKVKGRRTESNSTASDLKQHDDVFSDHESDVSDSTATPPTVSSSPSNSDDSDSN